MFKALIWVFDAIRMGITGRMGTDLRTKLNNLNHKLQADGLPPVTPTQLQCAARFGIPTTAEVIMKQRRIQKRLAQEREQNAVRETD